MSHKNYLIPISISCLFLILTVQARTTPQESTGFELLKKLIEQQQAQLKQQQELLKRQQDQLAAQARQLEGLTVSLDKLTSESQVKGALPQAVGAKQNLEAVKVDSEFPGSFGIPGTSTRMKVSGYAKFDAIHDFDAITTPDLFEPSAIPIPSTVVDGSEGQTHFSVRQSQLQIESRTPVDFGQVKTYTEVDFFDGSVDNPALHLRQFYGEVTTGAGSFLVGQSWSTFADPDALPDTLDFQGPNSSLQMLQPQFRWTRGTGENTSVALAVERASSSVINGNDLTRWPDGVAAFKWAPNWGHLRVAGVFRDIRSNLNDDDPAQAGFGAGVSFSGIANFAGGNDVLTFQYLFGPGIGRYLEDLEGDDGVFDPGTGELDLLTAAGGYVGFAHHWNSFLRSTITYGSLLLDNKPYQSNDAFNRSQYASANLIWRPVSFLDFGAEFLWGERKNKDGEKGKARRLQLSGIFNF